MNDCISYISVVKAFPDALLCYRTAPPIEDGEEASSIGVIGEAWYLASPWIELALNFVWFVPPAATLIYPDEGVLIKPASQVGTVTPIVFAAIAWKQRSWMERVKNE